MSYKNFIISFFLFFSTDAIPSTNPKFSFFESNKKLYLFTATVILTATVMASVLLLKKLLTHFSRNTDTPPDISLNTQFADIQNKLSLYQGEKYQYALNIFMQSAIKRNDNELLLFLLQQ